MFFTLILRLKIRKNGENYAYFGLEMSFLLYLPILRRTG